MVNSASLQCVFGCVVYSATVLLYLDSVSQFPTSCFGIWCMIAILESKKVAETQTLTSIFRWNSILVVLLMTLISVDLYLIKISQ